MTNQWFWTQCKICNFRQLYKGGGMEEYRNIVYVSYWSEGGIKEKQDWYGFKRLILSPTVNTKKLSENITIEMKSRVWVKRNGGRGNGELRNECRVAVWGEGKFLVMDGGKEHYIILNVINPTNGRLGRGWNGKI